MQQVLFDPGYSSCRLGISESAEFMYSAFEASYMPLKQKKFQFSVLYPKLKDLIQKNVAFYLGCLLWACYISNIKDGIISDNPCLNSEFDKEDALSEVNFLINFLQTGLNRDVKYYLNKTYEADMRHINILKTYAEFIVSNKGFVSLEKTSEILLPENIKALKASDLEKIKNKIDEAVDKKSLCLLFDVYDLILE